MENAKMFLAGDRGVNETEVMRSYHSFNFGTYYNQHKTSFGNLYALNDDTLAPQQAIATIVEKQSYILLIPVVGTIRCFDETDDEIIVTAGQLLIRTCNAGEIVRVGNPLKEGLVNYLQIRITIQDDGKMADAVLLDFDLDKYQNNFAPFVFNGCELLQQSLPFQLCMGKFDGRWDVEYKVQRPGCGLYAFVIEGAFEVQNRLLHARDGLAIWNTTAIDAEALSNNAILLVVETQL